MFKPLKPPTTFSQQVNLLNNRNIVISDPVFCEKYLSQVNYYRVTGYLLPFVTKPSEICTEAVDFKRIAEIYTFDAEIRNLLFSVIEKIEIYIRTRIANYYSLKYGADGYLDANNFNLRHEHIKFQNKINRCISENSKSPVVDHHIKIYGGKFPLWVIVDYFSLGMLSHFYTDLKNPDKAYLAQKMYGTNYQILSSWLRCLTDLRNRCAHYSRLYYWKFTAIPASSPSQNRTLFEQLIMLKKLYPEPDKWNEIFIKPLSKIMKKYGRYIDKNHIGFPYRWKSILMIK